MERVERRNEQGDSDRTGEKEKIVGLVKHQIIFGRLKPRERLIEDELCARFQASRHLIRSAFVTLEHMGLVTRRPNKGAVVRDFSVDEVEDIYDMRALLQGEAARRIPLPVPRALLDRLEAIHAEHARAVERQDLGLVCTINNEFHCTFFAACGSRYLAQTIERLWTETLAIRCYAIGDPLLLARSQQEHGQIIEALACGDRARLVRHVIDHIWPALDAYKRAHGGWAAGRPAGPVATFRTARAAG